MKSSSLRTLPPSASRKTLASRSNSVPDVARGFQPRPITNFVRPGSAFDSDTLAPLASETPMGRSSWDGQGEDQQEVQAVRPVQHQLPAFAPVRVAFVERDPRRAVRQQGGEARLHHARAAVVEDVHGAQVDVGGAEGQAEEAAPTRGA